MNTVPNFDNISNSTLQEFAIDLWNSLWFAYKLKGSKGNINLTYWADKAQEKHINIKDFNLLLISLANKKYIKCTITRARNWAECTLHPEYLSQFTDEELIQLRKQYGYKKYSLPTTTKGTFKGVKTYQGTMPTGLIRKGFESSCNTQYCFDTTALNSYADEVSTSITKGMDKIRAVHSASTYETDYDELALDLIENLNSTDMYTLGDLYLDSRGRAVYSCLNSPINPISNKLFRGAIKCTSEDITDEGIEAVFLFIAELTGSKATNTSTKLQAGKIAWVHNRLTNNANHDIWLERIYANLDKVYLTSSDVIARHLALDIVTPSGKWDVPIELDASASMLGITGTLLGDKNLLESCNITSDSINDPWYIEGLPRKLVKSAYTPILYGSSASPEVIWQKDKLEYTEDHVHIAKSNLLKGKFALANTFKSFVLSNVQPKETMNIRIWDDSFTIHCNKYKRVGDKPVVYTLYDSNEKLLKNIQHAHPKNVPDLESFKLYFQTLLVHNLDSQVMNKAIVHANVNWSIPIHDAILLHPNNATNFRKCYWEALKDLYENRKNILQGYFNSIGITQTSQNSWSEVKNLVEPVENFTYNSMVLK